jgi:hypothetical protein
MKTRINGSRTRQSGGQREPSAPSHQHLRERLKQEALANAERDLRMAAEWFPLEEEAWRLAQARVTLTRTRDTP